MPSTEGMRWFRPSCPTASCSSWSSCCCSSPCWASSCRRCPRKVVQVLGESWSLGWLSGPAIYLLGVGVETLIFAAIYMIMPAGRTRLHHALFGGLTAALLWEVTRHGLIWYFSTLSQRQHHLRLADHFGRRAVHHGNRRHAAAAWRPGDLRIREDRAGSVNRCAGDGLIQAGLASLDRIATRAWQQFFDSGGTMAAVAFSYAPLQAVT